MLKVYEKVTHNSLVGRRGDVSRSMIERFGNLRKEGSHSLLQKGAQSVLLRDGFRVCLAACSVRSS